MVSVRGRKLVATRLRGSARLRPGLSSLRALSACVPTAIVAAALFLGGSANADGQPLCSAACTVGARQRQRRAAAPRDDTPRQRPTKRLAVRRGHCRRPSTQPGGLAAQQRHGRPSRSRNHSHSVSDGRSTLAVAEYCLGCGLCHQPNAASVQGADSIHQCERGRNGIPCRGQAHVLGCGRQGLPRGGSSFGGVLGVDRITVFEGHVRVTDDRDQGSALTLTSGQSAVASATVGPTRDPGWRDPAMP